MITLTYLYTSKQILDFKSQALNVLSLDALRRIFADGISAKSKIDPPCPRKMFAELLSNLLKQLKINLLVCLKIINRIKNIYNSI